MDSFQQREKSFEDFFAHDEEIKFKLVARKNKLFGLWLASKIGKEGKDAEEFALSLVSKIINKGNNSGIMDIIKTDIANTNISQDLIVDKFNEFEEIAKNQIMSENDGR